MVVGGEQFPLDVRTGTWLDLLMTFHDTTETFADEGAAYEAAWEAEELAYKNGKDAGDHSFMTNTEWAAFCEGDDVPETVYPDARVDDLDDELPF